MRVRKFPIFLLVVITSVIGGGLYELATLTKSKPFNLNFFEKVSPKLSWGSVPKGLGADPIVLTLNAEDTGAGLDEVVVRIDQKNVPQELLRKRFETKENGIESCDITIDSKALALREGKANIRASAFDKSIWSNAAEISMELPVSFIKPRVEVLTVQHNASSGGSELVFFRFVGRELVQGGVLNNGKMAQAMLASALDPAFSAYPTIYFSLFPLFVDNDGSTKLELKASDIYGNSDTSSFNYRIKKNKIPQSKIELSDDFLNKKTDELGPLLNPKLSAGKDKEEIFKMINEDLRKENEATLATLLSSPSEPCQWRKAFIRPLAAAPKSTFGEARSYIRNNHAISHSMHMGIDLADVAAAKVTAAQTGKVIFVGDLGIYGNAVVIDHGCYVSTLYGHLSVASVAVGQQLDQGEELGRTGATGLAGGDHLHYEVRVHGTPVSPYEWWDPMWVRDHIDGKVKQVQQSLIGSPGE